MVVTTNVRQRDAERSREAILDAAEELFAAHGIDGTTLQAIGERAGVSRGLPNYLFGSKEALYQAVLEQLLQAEHAAAGAVEELLAREDVLAEAVFRAAIGSHIAFLCARPAFLQLLNREALRGGVGLHGAHNYLAVLQAGKAVIEREQARGAIAAGDPEQLLMHVLALCWFPFSHHTTVGRSLGSDWSRPDFVVTHTEAVVRLLFDGIRRETQEPRSAARRE